MNALYTLTPRKLCQQSIVTDVALVALIGGWRDHDNDKCGGWE